jgi:hypothetical protein
LVEQERAVIAVDTARRSPALAALLNGRIGAGSRVGAYTDVYLFCTIATFAVAVAALWLVLEETP